MSFCLYRKYRLRTALLLRSAYLILPSSSAQVALYTLSVFWPIKPFPVFAFLDVFDQLAALSRVSLSHCHLLQLKRASTSIPLFRPINTTPNLYPEEWHRNGRL